jgi:hypothetical protein
MMPPTLIVSTHARIVPGQTLPFRQIKQLTLSSFKPNAGLERQNLAAMLS